MKRRFAKGIGFGLWILSCAASAGPAEALTKAPSRNILATPHNLSISGGGGDHDIKSSKESRVCIFCHTPHHAQPVAQLWSRDAAALSIYIPYSSPTLKTTPQQPRGASRVCLSCHDGTIALGLLAGGYNLDPGLPTMPRDTDPSRNANLGTDLSDDHPISMAYLPGAHPEMRDPFALDPAVRLAEDTYVECITCHDPHNNQYGNFLALDSSAQHDALCTACHQKTGWTDPDTAHRTGGTRYASVSAAVAAKGCRNCHLPHSGEGTPYLLRSAQEEVNCLASCHNGFPYVDVASAFTATLYHHPVEQTQGVHRANPFTGFEDVPVSAADKHVECADCHNPHRSGAQGSPLGSPTPALPPASTAPDVNGPLRGVRGVDKTGTTPVPEARFEYEICFKCHAGGSADRFTSFGPRPVRQYEAFDQSLRFYLGNPSFHPVTEDRRGNGASLLADLQAGMIRIYCSDCHAAHGSNEPHALRASNPDTYPSSLSTYTLCFRCHDQNYLMDATATFRSTAADLHRTHVRGKNVPCATCHDPHGVPSARGGTTVNAAHLINFDLRATGPAPVYDAVGRSCTVSCHTRNPRTY